MLLASILTLQRPENTLPDKYGTLREEVEICRVLCGKTLASLAADMDEVSSMSGRLCAESGPVRIKATTVFNFMLTFEACASPEPLRRIQKIQQRVALLFKKYRGNSYRDAVYLEFGGGEVGKTSGPGFTA